MNLDFADRVVASFVSNYTNTAIQSRDQMFSVARAAYQFAEVVFEVREEFKKKHSIDEKTTEEGFASYLVRYIDAVTQCEGEEESGSCCGCDCSCVEEKEVEKEVEVKEEVEEKEVEKEEVEEKEEKEEVVVEKKKRGRKPLLAVAKKTTVIADADVFTELNGNNDSDNTNNNDDSTVTDTSVTKRTRKPRLQADEEKKTRSKKKEEKSDVFVSVKDLPTTPFITDVDDTQPVTVIADAPRRRGRPRKVI